MLDGVAGAGVVCFFSGCLFDHLFCLFCLFVCVGFACLFACLFCLFFVLFSFCLFCLVRSVLFSFI